MAAPHSASLRAGFPNPSSLRDSEQGVAGAYREDEIIHIKGMCYRNPKSGLSVLSYARMALDTASAGDIETKKRFATGGIVRGIVSNDKSVRT